MSDFSFDRQEFAVREDHELSRTEQKLLADAGYVRGQTLPERFSTRIQGSLTIVDENALSVTAARLRKKPKLLFGQE